MFSRLRSFLTVWTRRERFEESLDEEVRFHLDAYAEDLFHSGVPRRDAVRQARVRFGSIESMKDDCRQARGLRFADDMATVVQDIRSAFRFLLANRGFAAAILLTVALGVGGTAAVFSVIYGVLLRPLPYAESERLVRLWEVHPGANAPFGEAVLSVPTYRSWSASSASLDAIGSYRTDEFAVTGAGAGRRVRGVQVTPSLFRVLRATPAVGRLFRESDAARGAAPVVVLAYTMWQQRFGGDPNVIGRRLAIDGVDHRIVGIVPPGFSFPPPVAGAAGQGEIELYTPFEVPAVDPEARVIGVLQVIGRLADGATEVQATVEATAHARRVGRPFADLVFGEGAPVEVRVRSMVEQMTLNVRPALLLLVVGAGLLLAIACANVTNLLLSRASTRGREFATRAALGAGRRRLLRQVLTESVVFSLVGGVPGLFVGWVLTTAVQSLAPADFPRPQDIRVDMSFFVAGGVVAVFVGSIAGVLPALRQTGLDLATAIQVGGSRSMGSAGRGLRETLVAVEVALAIVLLVGGALCARSFVKLLSVDAGFDAANVLVADIHVPEGSRPTRGEELAVATLERLREVPRVVAAGAGNMTPHGGRLYNSGFRLPGMTTPDGEPLVATALHSVITPGFAEALNMRLAAGRFLAVEDTTAPIIAMLVNEAFVDTYFNDGRPAVGRRFSGMFPGMVGRDDAVVEVVGVVENVLLRSPDQAPQPQIYVPYGVGFGMRHATLVVRTDGDPATSAPLLTGIVRQLDPVATLGQMGPLTDKVGTAVEGPRFAAFVVGAFAVLALSLATAGLYGVLSFGVNQRRREIGVRAALGATPTDLVVMVLKQGMTVTVIGLAMGLAGSIVASRAMASVLFGVEALDGVAFIAPSAIVLVVAAASCYLPGRRAAAVDPAEVLLDS